MSFLEALHEKYAPEGALVNDGMSSTLQSSPKVEHYIRWGGKIVEEVGFEKIRQKQAHLQELTIVLLDGHAVAGLTSDAQARDKKRKRFAQEAIRRTCPNIVELDLSRNLLEKWEEVFGICRELKRLKSLRLKYADQSNTSMRRLSMLKISFYSGNRFTSLGMGSEGGYDKPGSATELILDQNLLSWEDVSSLA